jgi:hypothetical protein
MMRRVAISEITRDGPKVTKSSSDSIEFLWSRRAFPCRDLHLIVVNQNVDGTISEMAASVNAICL